MMVIEIDKQITLELISPKHAAELYELANANRSYLREWISWVDHMSGPEFFQKFIQNSRMKIKEGQDLPFVIVYNGKIVGRIGIYKLDYFNKVGEIGYWIGENAQGKGIVSKSCGGLIEYAFSNLHLNRLEIKCGVSNIKSQQIPGRFNFQHEGIIREGELLRNKYNDLNLYSLLKKDWE
jgi:ribosomal-protein-serine acetyltransferase